MHRLLSNGLVLLAGFGSLASPVNSQKVPEAEYRHDARLARLRAFLENSPAAMLAHVFLEEADRYRLDWRLLPSISFLESGGGRTAKNNNLFGWECGRAAFRSMGDGIRHVAQRLANANHFRGKDTDGILRAYNPNEDYTVRVRAVMRRIAPTEQMATE